MYGPSPYERTEDVEEGLELCFVTGELEDPGKMVFDSWEVKRYTKGLEKEYNDKLSLEYGWSQEEKQDNLKRLLTK